MSTITTKQECADILCDEFDPYIDSLGYTLSCNDDDHTVKDHYPAIKSDRRNVCCICINITPKLGSLDPIEPALLVRIRKRILPKNFRGHPVTVTYQGAA